MNLSNVQSKLRDWMVRKSPFQARVVLATYALMNEIAEKALESDS